MYISLPIHTPILPNFRTIAQSDQQELTIVQRNWLINRLNHSQNTLQEIVEIPYICSTSKLKHEIQTHTPET